MSLSSTIDFKAVEELLLDPHNPRLGLGDTKPAAPQETVLELMRSWKLEELATSFLESHFWPQEAVIVVKEDLYDEGDALVVVEGNRRIAALKYLKETLEGSPPSRVWRQLVENATLDEELFEKIPTIRADTRQDVVAYLGFRHVTGIKQWDPTQKAQFIAAMIDDMQMSYETVRKQIGMLADTVRRNYIAFRMVRQIEDLHLNVSSVGLEKRFSVLFLSLKEKGVREFLGIDVAAEPSESRIPVSEDKVENLSDFAGWLFGHDGDQPLFSDSRQVGNFARILASTEAVDYLKSSPSPSFEVALQKAGIEDEEIESQLKEASTQMELALSRIHLHLDSDPIRKAMWRLARGARELVSKFPEIAKDIGLRRDDTRDA